MRGQGFDTVALSFRVRRPDTQPGAILTSRAESWGGKGDVRSLRKLPSGGTLRTGVGGRGVVEISARYGRENNVTPLPWVESVEAVRSAFSEATEYVEPLESFDDGRFVRVDACRDFDGGRGWPVLAAALEPTLRFPRARSRMFRDRSRGNSLMLAIGNTGWRAAVYDKHAESFGAAPEGRLRYEYRQGREWCRRLHVEHGSAGQTFDRARMLFQECRFSARVSGMDEVLQSVLEDSGLKPAQRMALLGWVFAESRKVDLGLNRHTDLRYRRLCARLGIAAATVEDSSVVVALDYDRGRMVTEVAA